MSTDPIVAPERNIHRHDALLQLPIAILTSLTSKVQVHIKLSSRRRKGMQFALLISHARPFDEPSLHHSTHPVILRLVWGARGRTSTAPNEAAGQRAALPRAASSDGSSKMVNPPSCSLVSAYGPSCTPRFSSFILIPFSVLPADRLRQRRLTRREPWAYFSVHPRLGGAEEEEYEGSRNSAPSSSISPITPRSHCPPIFWRRRILGRCFRHRTPRKLTSASDRPGLG